MRLRPDVRTVAFLAAVTFCCPPPAPASVAAPATAPAAGRVARSADVERMIVAAKAYVYAQQKNGTWETSPQPVQTKTRNDTDGAQWGGLTALATYALLAAGEDPQDKRLAPAIAFLKQAKLVGTYALGLRCQVMLLLPPTPETRAIMRADAAALQGMIKTKDPATGFYDYDASGGPKTYSLSRAQYAVLGMWACAQAGVEVPASYWELIDKAWTRDQDASGGWTYSKGSKAYPYTPGITAVGVATLYIAQEYLFADVGAKCRGNLETPAIERGLRWMEQHFDDVATDRRYPRDFPYATLYSVERIGLASGRKYFGKVDWFEKGSTFLLREQMKDGSWRVSSGGDFVGPLANTCFGLLFLSRGRAPGVMNKLEYLAPVGAKVEAQWNLRPRDAANLARWIGRASERDLNWQVVNLDAPAADLHDAPILYVSGSDALPIDDAGLAKLRAFAEGGGIILGHADCAGRAFATSFRTIGQKLFPNYKFRELPADHPIYKAGYPREKWKAKPSVLGLSNGVRELMLLIPQADPGRAWQAQATKTREEMYQLGANIFLYAIDRKNARFRGEGHWVEADPAAAAPKAAVAVARIEHAGNWDPEPGGWRRLAAVLRNAKVAPLDVKPVTPAAGAIGGQVAHLTGTQRFTLDPRARAAIKTFIDGGGTLVVDAAGGAPAFAEAAEAEVAAILPGAKLAPLPADHAVYAAGGPRPAAFGYRRAARDTTVGRSDAPRLQGATIGGRVAVFFSREDLSAGLVGQDVDGIVGYDPKTATTIMTKVLSYAAKLPAPATQPAATTQPADLGTKSKPKSKSTTGKSKTRAPKRSDPAN